MEENFSALRSHIKNIESQIGKNETLKRMEARFHDVPCDPPKLPKEQKARRSQLKKWLGSSAKEIFSIGFSLYKSGELDEKKVDAFCSENLLRHVLLLSQANEFDSEDFKFLNRLLEKELLPYLLLKYPYHSKKYLA